MTRTLKMKVLARVLVPALAIGFASSGFATDAKTGAMNATPSANMKNQPMAGPAKHVFRDMRASKLIGTDVRNAQNENLGEIKDLVIDVNNARVHYAVLSFGGFLGLGDKLFAYPIGAFSPSADGDKLVLNIDKEKLKAAPGFEAQKYPEWNDHKYETDVNRYFGPTVALERMPNQNLRRATELIGKDVNDRNGKDVGEIEDLVINIGNGRVHYAVLEFDKSWSLNDKLLAIPLRAMTYTDGRKDLVLNVDKSKLDTKLAFDKNRWPDINNPTYLVDVDRYLMVVVPEKTAMSNNSMDRSDAAFRRLDTNNDGMLSNAEAGKDTAVMGMWKQLDKDGNGSISRAEFVSGQHVSRK